MKNLEIVKNMTKEEVLNLFDEADEYRGKRNNLLKQKTLGMIFEKASTRTRVSFEVAMYQTGGQAIFLSKQASQLGRGEPIKDTARVLSRYCDGIMARVFEHSKIEDLVKYSDVPVINGLSDEYHPCQSLTDYYTIWRKKGLDAKVVFLGDGSDNVCHSLINTATVLGKEIVVSCPDQAKYHPKVKGNYEVIHDPHEAVSEADVVYTDVWVSMGETEEKERDLMDHQVNQEVMSKAKSDAIFMHCLPAHRGKEVTDEVMESSNSVVFDQAENRLHLQKALLLKLMK